jgi:hypothetical protein
MEDLREQPEMSTEARIRILGFNLGFGSQYPTSEKVSETNIEVARLTAGIDPDSIDKNSPEYLMGAADAFSQTLGTLVESMPSKEYVDFLEQKNNAEVLVSLAATPGISIDERQALELRALLLIEAAKPLKAGEKGWRLTPWGEGVFFRFLRDELPQMVEEEQLLKGVSGIIQRNNKLRAEILD